ncbi:MAG: hypothetical protein WA397_02755 [Roseiarcus sp.]
MLDKIRNICHMLALAESHSHSLAGERDKDPWLFETLAYNLSREPGRGSDFLNYIARNLSKRLDSQK